MSQEGQTKTSFIIESELKEHIGAINSIIQLRDGNIASCSDDATIKVWDLKTNTVLFTLQEHYARVICLIQLPEPDNRLASGSFDTSIRLWDLNTQKCTLQLGEHEAWVLDMIILKDKRLASCSGDKTIKVWNVKKGKTDFSLSGHEGYVNTIIQNKEGQLISASEDKTVRFWDLNAKNCIRKILFDTVVNSMIEIRKPEENKSYILLATGNKIKKYNGEEIEDDKELKSLETKEFVVTSKICEINDMVVYGNEEGMLQGYSISKGRIEIEVQVHEDTINNIIRLNDGRILTCGNDSLMRIVKIG